MRDLSGDQVDDTVVADPEMQSATPGPGEVRLHSGQDGQLFTRLIGRIEGSRFGYDVAIAGDLNLDGWLDLIVGAPRDGAGRAFVFYGPFDYSAPPVISANNADLILAGSFTGDHDFGDRVAPLWDHDNDGVPELRVLSWFEDAQGVETSRTWIFSGASGEGILVIESANLGVSWPDVPGDADGDADVDWDDVLILLSHLGLIADVTAYQGDVDGDGLVSLTDLNLTLDHLGDNGLDFGGVAGGTGEWIINPCDGLPIWQSAGSQLIFCCCAEYADCECPEIGISPPPGFEPPGGVPPGGGGPPPGCAIHIDKCDGGEPPQCVCAGSVVCLKATGGAGPSDYVWEILYGEATFVGDNVGKSIVINVQGPGDIAIGVTRGCETSVVMDSVMVDLDIDSDNDDGYSSPDRSTVEEEREAVVNDTANPGKLVLLSAGDWDDDGVPDFADGIDVHSNAGTNASHLFTPLVLDLSNIHDVPNVAIRFTYSASDPAGITQGTDEFGDPIYVPAPGSLRIWTKNGLDTRHAAGVELGGDFIRPLVDYTPAQLGANSQCTLYVEAVRGSTAVSDLLVSVATDVNQTCSCTDEVRLTAVQRVHLAYRDVEQVHVLGLKLSPVYTDDANAVGHLYAGELLADSATLSVGLDGPNPSASSLATKDVEYFRIRLQIGENSFLPVQLSPTLITSDLNPDDAYWNAGLGGVASSSENEVGDWVDPNPGDLDPDGFDAEFEIVLSDKYDSAEPSIGWLEREALELWGWTYGGQSWQFWSGRNVWRDGSVIYVEDSLTAEEAADEYYNFLLETVGPNTNAFNITPTLRHFGEIYDAQALYIDYGTSRADVGQTMARHWHLVDALTTDLETEFYTVGAGFALGGTLDFARAKNVRFTPDTPKKWPLYRRNFARGKWVEYDTIELSLLRSRNFSPIEVTLDGVSVTTVPDGIYSQSILEIKDWLRLSKAKQIAAQAAVAADMGRTYVLVGTSRTKKVSAPLYDFIKQQNSMRFLLKLNINGDSYLKWEFEDPVYDVINPDNLAGQRVPILKSDVQSLLAP